MKSAIAELNKIVSDFSEKIRAIPDDEFSAKPLPAKWSKKEVLGHLIDSAQNNLRRFICGQYESTPSKIVYNQDLWVAFNDYQQTDKTEIIALWTLMNRRIAAVLGKMPATSYSKSSDTGRESVALHPLAWLADDYVKHLKHHLNQIIPGSFAVHYP